MKKILATLFLLMSTLAFSQIPQQECASLGLQALQNATDANGVNHQVICWDPFAQGVIIPSFNLGSLHGWNGSLTSPFVNSINGEVPATVTANASSGTTNAGASCNNNFSTGNFNGTGVIPCGPGITYSTPATINTLAICCQSQAQGTIGLSTLASVSFLLNTNSVNANKRWYIGIFDGTNANITNTNDPSSTSNFAGFRWNGASDTLPVCIASNPNFGQPLFVGRTTATNVSPNNTPHLYTMYFRGFGQGITGGQIDWYIDGVKMCTLAGATGTPTGQQLPQQTGAMRAFVSVENLNAATQSVGVLYYIHWTTNPQ